MYQRVSSIKQTLPNPRLTTRAVDPALQRYINDLRKERREAQEPGPQVVFQDDEDGGAAEADESNDDAPDDDAPRAKRTAKAAGLEEPPTKRSRSWKDVPSARQDRCRELLRAKLLSVKPLVLEGLANARSNDRCGEHAITEAIEGLESESFTLMAHQRDDIGRCLYLLRKFGAFLLADDMGLGKTIEIIGIILIRMKEMRSEGTRRPFFIAVPPTLMSTWLGEFKSRAPSIKVLVYNPKGKGTTCTKRALKAADVVISAFGPLETMYQRLETLQLHRKAVQEGFEQEVRESLDARYARAMARPRGRQAGVRKPEFSIDLVSEPLLAVQFELVMIDEAHNIKNPDTNRASLMRLLKARSRGALTGTPVQNGYKDFHALLKFLRIPPFDEFALFKACFMRKKSKGKVKQGTRQPTPLNDAILCALRNSMTVRRVKDQTFEGSQILELPYSGEEAYHVALTSGEPTDYQQKTRSIWDVQVRQKMTDDELLGLVGDPVSRRSKHEVDILADILRARLHVIHPQLINAKYGEFGLEDFNKLKPGDDAAYGVVPREARLVGADLAGPDAPRTPGVVARRYERHLSDDEQRLRDNRRKNFVSKFEREPGRWESDRLFAIVTTIEELLARRSVFAEAKSTSLERKTYLATHKILVFSEYLSALDLIDIGIKERLKIQPLRFDGTCTQEQRNFNRREFEEEGKDFSLDGVEPHAIPIMLVSNKAGAEGITLVHASDVIIVAPVWNPSVEDQCVARAARMGQQDAVTVHRFMSEQSIENRVIALHEIKRQKTSRVMDDAYLLKYAKRVEQWVDEDGDADFLDAVSASTFPYSVHGVHY